MTNHSSKDSVTVVADDATEEIPATEAEVTFTEVTDSTIDKVRDNALPFILGGTLLVNPPLAAAGAAVWFGGRAVYSAVDSILHRNCRHSVQETPVTVEIAV